MDGILREKQFDAMVWDVIWLIDFSDHSLLFGVFIGHIIKAFKLMKLKMIINIGLFDLLFSHYSLSLSCDFLREQKSS